MQGKIIKIALYAVLLLLLAYSVYFLFFTRMGVRLTHVNVLQLAGFLRSFGVYAGIFGALGVLLQTIFPFVPFVVAAGANVIILGFCKGFLVNYGMSLAGAVIAFFFSRYISRQWVARRLEKYPLITFFNEQLDRRGILYILAARLIPILPSSAVNMGAGISGIRFRQFLIGTCLGKLPMVFFESLIGYDLLHFRRNKIRLLALLLVFLALILLGSWIRKKLARNKYV